jgi:hypothetical protein
LAIDVTAAPASDAEALSCATAGRYAGRWARSVARPVDDDRPDPPAPWFIDGFAGADLQRAALRGATVQPAALLAVQALDDAAEGRARIVLIEEDPGLISRLGEMLDGIGAGGRVRISSDPATAEPGEILLVEAAFASHAHRLVQRIGDEPALVRLAPLAAGTLPWSALEPIMDLGAGNVLLRFPREDFEKQARFTGPLADLPPHLRRVVEGCSNFMGDARHGWLIAWRQAQRTAGPDAALVTAVERMQALLAPAGGERIAHTLRIAGKTESVHLILSTPHAEHPLELDGALADAGTRQKPPSRRKAAPGVKSKSPAAAEAAAPAADPVVQPPAPSDPAPGPSAVPADAAEAPEPVGESVDEPAAAPPPPETSETVEESPAVAEPTAGEVSETVVEPAAAPAEEPVDEPSAAPPAHTPAPAAEPPALAEPAAALDLFALAPQPEPRGPDLAALADDLYARHMGARVPVGDLLATGAAAGLTPEHVRGALASLKRAGRVSYRSLDAEGAEVEFLAEPRVSAPRPRKPRTPDPGVLGLFDEPEE